MPCGTACNMVRPRVAPISACGRNASAVTDMKSSHSRRNAKSSYRHGKIADPALHCSSRIGLQQLRSDCLRKRRCAEPRREPRDFACRPGAGVIVSVGVLRFAFGAARSILCRWRRVCSGSEPLPPISQHGQRRDADGGCRQSGFLPRRARRRHHRGSYGSALSLARRGEPRESSVVHRPIFRG